MHASTSLNFYYLRIILKLRAKPTLHKHFLKQSAQKTTPTRVNFNKSRFFLTKEPFTFLHNLFGSLRSIFPHLYLLKGSNLHFIKLIKQLNGLLRCTYWKTFFKCSRPTDRDFIEQLEGAEERFNSGDEEATFSLTLWLNCCTTNWRQDSPNHHHHLYTPTFCPTTNLTPSHSHAFTLLQQIIGVERCWTDSPSPSRGHDLNKVSHS